MLLVVAFDSLDWSSYVSILELLSGFFLTLMGKIQRKLWIDAARGPFPNTSLVPHSRQGGEIKSIVTWSRLHQTWSRLHQTWSNTGLNNLPTVQNAVCLMCVPLRYSVSFPTVLCYISQVVLFSDNHITIWVFYDNLNNTTCAIYYRSDTCCILVGYMYLDHPNTWVHGFNVQT